MTALNKHRGSAGTNGELWGARACTWRTLRRRRHSFLPYEDRAFDLVTGFHSFPFAADPLAALQEAARVAKPGGSLFIVIFGRKERNKLATVFRAIRSLLPPTRPGAPGPTALSDPGVLDDLLARVGVAIVDDGLVTMTYEYPDLDTALRAIRSAGLTLLAERAAGEATLTGAIAGALAPFRIPGGGYRLEVESRYILAHPRGTGARRSDIVSFGGSRTDRLGSCHE